MKVEWIHRSSLEKNKSSISAILFIYMWYILLPDEFLHKEALTRKVISWSDVFIGTCVNQAPALWSWRIPCWFPFRFHPDIKWIVIGIISIADIATPSHWHPSYPSNLSDFLFVPGVNRRNCKCTYRPSPPKSYLDERVCHRFQVLKNERR